MSWWKLKSSKQERVDAEWLGEKLADILMQAWDLKMLSEWHSSAGLRCFIALASLAATGYRIGANQKSVGSRIDGDTLMEIHNVLVSSLIRRTLPEYDPSVDPGYCFEQIIHVADRFIGTFYESAKRDLPEHTPPHWFVGKDVCMYILNDAGVPNPEEVMIFAQVLSGAMTTTKGFLDQLLDAGISIVPSQRGATGSP